MRMPIVTVQVTLELLKRGMQNPLSSISWSTVHYLAGEICYGGRVTDSQDRHCLRALLHEFCSDSGLQTDHPTKVST